MPVPLIAGIFVGGVCLLAALALALHWALSSAERAQQARALVAARALRTPVPERLRHHRSSFFLQPPNRAKGDAASVQTMHVGTANPLFRGGAQDLEGFLNKK